MAGPILQLCDTSESGNSYFPTISEGLGMRSDGFLLPNRANRCFYSLVFNHIADMIDLLRTKFLNLVPLVL